jgi:hypothetical protein
MDGVAMRIQPRMAAHPDSCFEERGINAISQVLFLAEDIPLR